MLFVSDNGANFVANGNIICRLREFLFSARVLYLKKGQEQVF